VETSRKLQKAGTKNEIAPHPETLPTSPRRPRKLWTALTDGEFTRQYCGGRRSESDWEVGSPRHVGADGQIEWLWFRSEIVTDNGRKHFCALQRLADLSGAVCQYDSWQGEKNE
jgi:hypothetical protein